MASKLYDPIDNIVSDFLFTFQFILPLHLIPVDDSHLVGIITETGIAIFQTIQNDQVEILFVQFPQGISCFIVRFEGKPHQYLSLLFPAPQFGRNITGRLQFQHQLFFPSF